MVAIAPWKVISAIPLSGEPFNDISPSPVPLYYETIPIFDLSRGLDMPLIDLAQYI